MHDAVLFCICSSTKLIICSVGKARCVFPGNRRRKRSDAGPGNPGEGFECRSGKGFGEGFECRSGKFPEKSFRREQGRKRSENCSERGSLWLRQQNFTVTLSPLIETSTHHPPLQENAFSICRRPVLFGQQSPIPAKEAACPLIFFSWLSPEAGACPYPGMTMFFARAIVFFWTA